jgi:hypothetical protein
LIYKINNKKKGFDFLFDFTGFLQPRFVSSPPLFLERIKRKSHILGGVVLILRRRRRHHHHHHLGLRCIVFFVFITQYLRAKVIY